MSKTQRNPAPAPEGGAPVAKWYQIQAAGEASAEVLIYGDIGDSWYGESVTAKDLVEELQQLDVTELVVRINSWGGSVSDGVAIYNALRAHPATVTVSIDGVAVSIASLIAMAGDTVKMAANGMFMVHAPWGGVYGNAKEMREYADVLDKFATAMSTSYERKSGIGHDEMLALLTDGEDHWYTAAEAIEAGFVDEVTDSVEMSASGLGRSRFAPSALGAMAAAHKFTHPAAPVAAITTKETPMGDVAKNKPATEATAGDVTQIQAAAEAKARAAIAQRNTNVRAMAKPFMQHEGMQAIVDSIIDNPDITEDQAREKILAKLGSGAEPLAPAGAGRVEILADERDKRVAAAQNVLLARAGVHRMGGNGINPMAIDLNGNPFRGSTLLDLARASLRAAGKNPEGMDKREVVAQAFQTTSDFPVLLENTIHKVLQVAYMTAPDTWTRFCKLGSVSDFRAHNRYRTGSIGNLDSLTEHGEFKRKTIPDGEKGSITAGTKGNIIAITREAIINDDLEALTGLAMMLGRAYKRTIEAAVYSLLGLNAGLGPTMADAKTLFHADHGNIGTAATISMAAIDADRVLMASQTDIGGNDYLDLRPAKLLVPLSLGGTARSINDAQYDPDTANKLQKPNIVNGLFDDIIDTPRLSGTRRYLFADPNEAPVIEVAFLDGMQEPYTETKDGWDVDGAELKVRGDFGVAAIDYRGAVTNAGTA